MSNFSINDFRKWIENSESEEVSKYIGEEVYCKSSPKKNYFKIEVQEGDEEIVIKEFSRNGGTIIDDDGDLFLLEITSVGTLLIPKNLVKIKN